jgi:ATP-dependent Clp protease ATP-binding subunit ClpX
MQLEWVTDTMISCKVLTEPKNALGKQFRKLFSMNNVRIFTLETCNLLSKYICVGNIQPIMCLILPRCSFQVKLHFTDAALRIIAQKAMCKNTGARGLRTILENILMDSMYEVCPMTILYTLS